MKTPALVIFSVLLSFFLLLFSPFTNLILENQESHTPTKQLLLHFAGLSGIPEVFDEQEKSHLQDVTILVRVLFLMLIITSIYLFRNKEWKKYTKKAIISLVIIILVSIILPFETIFSYFHKILFPQGNYTFASDSMLIQYYPEMFFRNYAIAIMIFAMIISAALLIISKLKINDSKLSLKKGIKKRMKKKI